MPSFCRTNQFLHLDNEQRHFLSCTETSYQNESSDSVSPKRTLDKAKDPRGLWLYPRSTASPENVKYWKKIEIKTSWLLFFRFKFYLYNDEGDLVQEQLSIHDIQHFLLHSTLPKSRLTKNAPSTISSTPTTTTKSLSSTSQVCSPGDDFLPLFP